MASNGTFYRMKLKALMMIMMKLLIIHKEDKTNGHPIYNPSLSRKLEFTIFFLFRPITKHNQDPFSIYPFLDMKQNKSNILYKPIWYVFWSSLVSTFYLLSNTISFISPE